MRAPGCRKCIHTQLLRPPYHVLSAIHHTQLMPETLYLTVNVIDRYLSLRSVTRKRLQLVGPRPFSP